MSLRDNEFVRMADEAERPTRWWVGWIVAALVIAGVGGAGQALGMAVLGQPEPQDERYQFVEVFMFGFTLLGLWLWLRFKERRPLSSLGFRGPNPVGRLLLGLFVGAAMMSVAVGILTLSGQYEAGASEHTAIGADAVLLLIPLLLLFVLQGSTEEALTRGYMLQVGARQLPGWVAVLGSSVFCAVIHLDFDPVTLLNLVCYAVFASVLVLWQRSLWLVCGIHAGWNFFQGNVFGVPVSGNSEAVSFWAFGPADRSSDLLTGADFGVEGGLVGTLVLGAGLVVALVLYRRDRSRRSERASAQLV